MSEIMRYGKYIIKEFFSPMFIQRIVNVISKEVKVVKVVCKYGSSL